MPVDDPTKVDAIGIDRATGSVVLTLVDARDWTDEDVHLAALQAKFNAYLDFIQTGQLQEAYPQAKGRELAIQVITKFPLSQAGQTLLQKAMVVASQLNVKISHMHLDKDVMCQGTSLSPTD